MKWMSHSPSETAELANKVALLLKDGDILCLSGDLGAGKTLWVQSMAQSLQLSDEVTSPTFALLHVYEGPVPLHHFDLYRLDSPEELEAIGFYEYTSFGISVIEWPDRFREEMPDDLLWIEIKQGSAPQERIITLTPYGRRFEALCKELTQVDCTSH